MITSKDVLLLTATILFIVNVGIAGANRSFEKELATPPLKTSREYLDLCMVRATEEGLCSKTDFDPMCIMNCATIAQHACEINGCSYD